jgi:hypothetical protein
MPVHLRLVHAEPGSRVVEASAVRQGEVLAMALGEGSTAEEAEQRARERLQQRLAEGSPVPAIPENQPAAPAPAMAPSGHGHGAPAGTTAPAASPSAPAPAPEHTAAAPENTAPAAPEEPPPDPEDWSAELARIDLALRRIGWQREQEGQYLERAFGHPSRSRLTTYGDLQAYLQQVERLEPGCDPHSAPVPLRRSELLAQSDALLGQLGWDAHQGRQFLERHLGRASRQQLGEAQLLQFNMLLEEAVMAAQPAGRPARAD